MTAARTAGAGSVCKEVATIEREFKFRKRMALSVLGSLITVSLHLTSAVNNLGLKFVYKMCD